MIRFFIQTGPLAGTQITTAAPVIRMGRDPSRNDFILDDEQVSARHCILQRSPRGAYVLEDLGSTNGTFVNDQRLTNLGRPMAVYLAARDRFRLGATTIEISDGQARIMIIGGPRAGREIMLDDRLITIGRAPDNLIELDDPKVSAHHGVIRPTPLGFTLEDHGSTNGTLLNGARVTSQILSDGDEIEVGDNVLRFLIDDLDTSDESDPAEEAALAKLEFVAGPLEGRSVPLAEDQVVFGRRDDCTMQVPDHLASGVHCAITRTDSHFIVTDLGSTNGTFINGQRITEGTALNQGDLIAFGQSIIEFRIAGGAVAAATGLTAMSTVMADGAYQLVSQPKFVIAGQVISAPHVKIGSSPQSDLRLDSVGVSKEHCRISWQEGFVLEDSSSHGTYLNDRRVVFERLVGEQVIRVGTQLINVSVRGERCSLELIDEATALAAIEVAREGSAALMGANLQEVSPDASMRFGALGEGYKTIFALQVPNTEALIRERKEKFKKGAPAWRPSTDIAPQAVNKVAVSTAVAASIAVCAFLVFTSSAGALMNHPLSEAHSSQRFADMAADKGLASDCTACHSIGSGVAEAKCATCHDGFDGGVRTAHQSGTPTAGHHLPGSTCTACHTEHRGTPRFLASGAPSQLGAEQRCSAAGCHPNQHSAEFLRQGPPPPTILKAGPVPDFHLPQREFHARHAVVELDGKEVAVGCTSCHGTVAASGELVEAKAGMSCFRCHEGGEDHVNGQCASCHADEHEGVVALDRAPVGAAVMAPATRGPTTGGSLLLGGGFAAAAFFPLLLVALVLRARRRKTSALVVKELQSHPVEMVKRLIHSINNDKCVGCAMCVQACPASVLELVDHKSRVINFDSCIQCKKCEAACAFDALRMHEADKPPPMIQMPEVDANYETPVAGMYLIGQASGTPQVKNASNLGRAVVQHAVSKGLRPGMARSIGADVDVAVIGSGPAGLSAALSCVQLGLSYVLLEKQRNFSWTIRNYYHKGKPVMAEPNEVEMVGLLPHWDTTREELLGTWEKLIHEQQVDIRYQNNVTDIKKDGALFRVAVSDAKGNPSSALTAARVVVAIGTMGNPRRLGCPGDDLEKVKNALVDPDEWVGKNVMVVGGTDSAIEVVMALCERNKVWMSCRGAKFDRVKPKNLKTIEEAIAAGKVIPMWATAVSGVSADSIELEYKSDSRKETLPNDVVFAMIGGHPPIKWLQSIGVPYVDKPHSWSPPRTDDLAKATGG